VSGTPDRPQRGGASGHPSDQSGAQCGPCDLGYPPGGWIVLVRERKAKNGEKNGPPRDVIGKSQELVVVVLTVMIRIQDVEG